MEQGSLQRLIDAEKPLFDVTRYFLTIIAWWGVIAVAWKAIPTTWSVYGVPVMLLPACAFGAVLVLRLTKLSEVMIYSYVEGALGARFRYGHPLRVAVTIGLLLLQSWMLVTLFSVIAGTFK